MYRQTMSSFHYPARTRDALSTVRDLALTVFAVLASLAILAFLYVVLVAGSAVDDLTGEGSGGSGGGVSTCTFDQADQQGRCPGDPDFEGAS